MINAAAFKESILCAYAALQANIQAINDLNVFPVPDGDTGTNMSMTLNNAVADHYPVTILERADEQQLNALRSLRWFIDCGDDDFLFDQNIEFYKALRMRRFNAQLRVRDGGHNWEYWHNALRLCLPFVSRAMGK